MLKTKAGHAVTNLFLLLLIAGLYIATARPQTLPVSAPVYRGSAKDAVSLQFTVTWNAAALAPILDILHEEGVQATFAVSGEWAEANPELALRIAQEGHELATMGHEPYKDGRLSWVREDLEASLVAIERAAHVRPTLYYSGERGKLVSSRAAKRLDLTQVLCTVDLLCARGTAEDIASRVSDGLIPGSIMLMQPTRSALGALPDILSILREKGMEPTTTSRVLGKG